MLPARERREGTKKMVQLCRTRERDFVALLTSIFQKNCDEKFLELSNQCKLDLKSTFLSQIHCSENQFDLSDVEYLNYS